MRSRQHKDVFETSFCGRKTFRPKMEVTKSSIIRRVLSEGTKVCVRMKEKFVVGNACSKGPYSIRGLILLSLFHVVVSRNLSNRTVTRAQLWNRNIHRVCTLFLRSLANITRSKLSPLLFTLRNQKSWSSYNYNLLDYAENPTFNVGNSLVWKLYECLKLI